MSQPLPYRVQRFAEKHGAVLLMWKAGRWELRQMDEVAHKLIEKYPAKVVGVYTPRARYAMIEDDVNEFVRNPVERI